MTFSLLVNDRNRKSSLLIGDPRAPTLKLDEFLQEGCLFVEFFVRFLRPLVHFLHPLVHFLHQLVHFLLPLVVLLTLDLVDHVETKKQRREWEAPCEHPQERGTAGHHGGLGNTTMEDNLGAPTLLCHRAIAVVVVIGGGGGAVVHLAFLAGSDSSRSCTRTIRHGATIRQDGGFPVVAARRSRTRAILLHRTTSIAIGDDGVRISQDGTRLAGRLVVFGCCCHRHRGLHSVKDLNVELLCIVSSCLLPGDGCSWLFHDILKNVLVVTEDS